MKKILTIKEGTEKLLRDVVRLIHSFPNHFLLEGNVFVQNAARRLLEKQGDLEDLKRVYKHVTIWGDKDTSISSKSLLEINTLEDLEKMKDYIRSYTNHYASFGEISDALEKIIKH